MRYLSPLLIFIFASCTDVDRRLGNGIDFKSMPVGAEFYFENPDQNRRWKQRFAGFQDGFYIMETYYEGADGSYSMLSSTAKFDALGRQVKSYSHKRGVSFSHAPFSCYYSSETTCEQQWTYPLGQGEFLEYRNKTQRFELIRRGRILTVTQMHKNSKSKITFELGKYNMRVRHSHTSDAGKKYLHFLTEIIEP